MVEQLAAGANIACSTGPQAVVGVTPDTADDVLVADLDLEWSGLPGVVAMSVNADTSCRSDRQRGLAASRCSAAREPCCPPGR